MKKTLLMTLALGMAGIANLKAYDVYITGSTAFRANVFTACTNLFSGTPNIYYGDANHGGANSGFSAKTGAWAMSGTASSAITNIAGQPLVIHALFNGSVQGLKSTLKNDLLTFPNADGTLNGNCNTYANAAPTIGFSDCDSGSTPYPASGNIKEEAVAVQPFVMCKSASTSLLMANINNVTFDQMLYGIPQGRLPLSTWTANVADTNTFIYLLERTKDSGTRRVFTQEHTFTFNDDPYTIYIYDASAQNFFIPTVLSNTPAGLTPNGVVSSGGAGLLNANLNWGYGYVGGGDIKTALGYPDTANLSISCLSIADAQSILSGSANNWSQVVPVNGLWPTAGGASIKGNTGTNDYSPIATGFYPLWGTEVLVHLINPQGITGQNLNQNQLGDNTKPGSFMGVFNAQTLITHASQPSVGSIEKEIENSKTGSPGATAIRLSEMINSRGSAGGTITPPFN